MNKQNLQQAASRLQAFPCLNFGHYPTPIEELPRLRQALGANAPRIFIKRDDYTGPGFGGNKVRKLEYVLAQAIADGAEVAITCGGLKSNHCRVTAAMCARLGLRCILVLNEPAQPSKLTPASLPASLKADEMLGAEIHRVQSRDERKTMMAAIAEQLRGEGKSVVVIPLGASIPLGALGFVRAVEETTAQLSAMNLRMDYIFHSTSSGGTQAGLVAGNQLFNLVGFQNSGQIIGVSADDSSASISAEVASIISGLGQMLGAEFDEGATVLDDYVGAGYGLNTPESLAAIDLLARTEGLFLDPVYTAKAMAGLLDWIRRGKFREDENILFWHTGGQLSLFYAPEKG